MQPALPSLQSIFAAPALRGWTLGLCVFLALAVGLPVASAADVGAADLKTQAHAVLETFCYDCHGNGGDEGGLSIDTLVGQPKSQEHQAHWLAVWKNLRAHTMPPSDMEQPSNDERQAVIRWIEQAVFELDPAKPDPGRVTMRRLNREEYRNTVRDMLGVEFNVNEEFPADDTGYGFDTIGEVLTISPLLMEKYLEAAEKIASKAVADDLARKDNRRIFTEAVPQEVADRKKYAKKILQSLADRAFRRPVEESTVDQLVELAALVDAQPNQKFEDGIAHSLTAILASPRFLFRAESQPDPNDADRVVPLDEFALASRLSYFLWSSLPDDELYRLAREKQLRANLRQQVDRMLQDKKGERFVRNFVGQWLQTRDVEGLNLNARRILRVRRNDEANRIFDRDVRRAMREETELMFLHLVRENGSLLDLLTADYSYLNADLAKFYGIDGVKGREFRKVQLPEDSHRRGILTHGSFLTVTSNPTRTSPVKRGLFVLENLLGTPTPPPPPDVPELEAVQEEKRGLTMRQLMEVHREQPLCHSCHARMDPLGLALENFNALGMWRDEENGKPIEAGGKLVTGEEFQTVHELAAVLASSRRLDFYRCVSEKLMTYALGRGVEYYDAPTIDRIVEGMDQSGGKIREMIYRIVESPAFGMRRGDDAGSS